MLRSAAWTALILAALTGCHSPGGSVLSYTGESQTYYSYEMRPVSVELIDLRNDQVLFSMDVPGGKQLTLDFKADKGDDPVYTPDLMRYQVWDIGTKTGRLRNSITVPAASSRRLDVYYRDEVEYAQPPPDRELRTDEISDRPAWWSPQGGEMPEDEHGATNYDG
jgi:hypothetical protein